jgi:RNA-directed DNA polymerase
LVNADELEAAFYEAEHRVLEIQTKLQRRAADPGCRFDDLFNLVADPAFLLVAWARVRGNKGGQNGRGGRAHSAVHHGVDGC